MIATNPRDGQLAAAVFVVTALFSGVASAEPYSHAPVTEYILLPKFCWAQFNDKLQGAEYTYHGCGVGANHYCEGLLNLQQSKKARNLDQKKIMLRKAKQDTLYTMNWLKRDGVIGSCTITSHVEQTMREIDLQFRLNNIK